MTVLLSSNFDLNFECTNRLTGFYMRATLKPWNIFFIFCFGRSSLNNSTTTPALTSWKKMWNAFIGFTNVCSSINEVIKTVLNFLLFFYEKILHAPKSTKKHKRHKNLTKQKHKNANKRTKIKNMLKKHLRGKKSLIRFFVFLCLRRKKIEESLQRKCWSH